MRAQNCIPDPLGGDCWRACLASIVGVDSSTMPNFMHAVPYGDGDAGRRSADEWLAEHGLAVFSSYCKGDWWTLDRVLEAFSKPSPSIPIIITGRTPCGTDNHAVVALAGKVVHDPSGVGIAGPSPCICKPDCTDAAWWIDVVSVTENWRMREVG